MATDYSLAATNPIPSVALSAQAECVFSQMTRLVTPEFLHAAMTKHVHNARDISRKLKKGPLDLFVYAASQEAEAVQRNVSSAFDSLSNAERAQVRQEIKLALRAFLSPLVNKS